MPTSPLPAEQEDAGPRVPKYWRLKQHLLDMTATLPPGSPLPTERSLAVEFDTSRTTVRQALQELLVEGRLHRVQGRGTFVAKPKLAQSLQLTSYTEDMKRQGLAPTSQLLSLEQIEAEAVVAERLAEPVGSPILAIERLRLADGEPMALERSHLSMTRFPDLARHFELHGSLYAALAEKYDVTPAEADETIETALATPREADLLGTEVGLPMLLLSRHSFDESGRPVEWVRSIYRGDRYKFVARLRRPES